MSDVGPVQNQVATAVEVKMVKLANEQQKQVANLVEAAAETAAQIQESGKGEHVDVLA